MVGDYYRYVCEVSTLEELDQSKQEARKAYEEAATIEMQPCSAVKLALALNQSVFFYEIMKDTVNACKITQTALDQAIDKVDELGESEFKEAKTIIDLMRENLNQWQTEEAG